MANDQDKRNVPAENNLQPGDMASSNQRSEDKSTEAEGTVKKDKDESEGYMDYNGNSEANAPARAREEQPATGNE